jgi:ceramide glucosyltransferase
MHYPWLIISTVFAGLALLESFLLSCQSWEHRRFARKRLRSRFNLKTGFAKIERERSCQQEEAWLRLSPDLDNKTPSVAGLDQRVVLFSPCKGIDLGFKDNLRPLFCQDYDNYELVFIVESDRDPACPIILKLIAEYPHVNCRFLVAGQASNTGQKVHNLRAATRQLAPEVKILAFVDSDARPHPAWLGQLVQRLSHPGVGIATGYRWFVPERPTLANLLLHSINATAASLYSPKGLNPVWGGSWAISRERFDGLKLREVWDGMLTDDLVATNLIRQANLKVEFEPTCMLASPLDFSFNQMFNFLRRQYLISRHYMPRWWALTLLATTLMILGFWGSLTALAAGLIWQIPGTWLPAVCCMALYLWGIVRASIRCDLARQYLPQRRHDLVRAMWFDCLAAPLAALVNWAAILSTMGERHLVWRGITYRLLADGKTCIIARRDEIKPVSSHWNEQLGISANSETLPLEGLFTSQQTAAPHSYQEPFRAA